jgi:sulfate adenylyltransferase large subunit
MSFSQEELIRSDIHQFLKEHEEKELLRFVTVGSVDDGKSTLIGRLLHDAKGVYEDQLEDAETVNEEGEVEIDFARITDGLQAEREQGITIDVAYRYFSTPRRKFIIADTPGHVQYTRNMATGASTANVAVILIDARLGVLAQSRRHAYIASLLGIPRLLVAVNKMDLADYSQDVYNEIVEDFQSFAEDLGFTEVKYIPISALMGSNIVELSKKTPWYDGDTVIGYLEDVPIKDDINLTNFRYPVQYVLRPNLDYRGFSGQISSGVIQKGDKVKVYPSEKTSTVESIDTYNGELEEAFAPMSVTLRLEDEIDISRGDLIVKSGDEPEMSRRLEAMVVWMSETGLDPDKTYLIKHTTRYIRAEFTDIEWKMDLEELERVDADTLELNDIAKVKFTTHRPLIFDPYSKVKTTGAFIIVDTLTNNTVGAGMIQRADADTGLDLTEEDFARSGVSKRERASRLRQAGSILWLSGLPGSGRANLAYELERQLFDAGYTAYVLSHHDVEERGLDLLSEEESAVEVAASLARAGLIAICALDGCPQKSLDALSSIPSRVIHMTADEETCRERLGDDQHTLDEKKDDYVAPSSPDASVDLGSETLDKACRRLIEALTEDNLLMVEE